MSRGKSYDDWDGALAGRAHNRVENRDGAVGLVASRHLTEHDRASPAKQPTQLELRQHAIDAIRPLVDFFQKQDATIRRIERKRRPE